MPPPPDANPLPPRPLAVLVADDEPLIVRALVRLLSGRGHQVRSAPDADTALALLEAQPFDVALVDANMPGSGSRVLAAFEERRSPHGMGILMTGDPAAVAGSGAAYHLQKPFRYDEVVRLVESGRPPGDG